jgi:tetratricopeptide (TPR) repeat protein
MTFSSFSVFAACLFALSTGGLCFAQNPQPKDKLADQAQREYAAGQFSEAERDFREITKHDPSNIFAHVYLGQALFRQEKYAESIGPYEKARDLERGGNKLSSDQHRILVDQLAMAYGISGDMKKVHALLEEAVRQDLAVPDQGV